MELEPDGREVVAKPRARLELEEQAYARQIALGDSVEVDEPEPGSSVIERILPRQTWLLRRNALSYRTKPQCVVANADQLAVVAAATPRVSFGLIDRYFIAAIQGGLTPLLVVNKIDLAPELRDHPLANCYRDQGIQVCYTSAATGEGLEDLAPHLGGKLTAFCGHSGVGKSSLLARLTGRPITTGAVNQLTSRGRQTTTSARLYHLPQGGMVVDTPGVREFGLAHLDWTDVHEYFADIAALTQDCAFRNCLHKSEPGCRVREAVAQGRLAQERLDGYIRLREESERPEWKQRSGLP